MNTPVPDNAAGTAGREMSRFAGTSLQPYYAPIEKELQQVRQRIADQLCSSDAQIQACLAGVNRRQGKMIRPAMTLLCGRMLSPLRPLHIPLAAMVELIHLASLLHDDVIDRADLRRGQVSMNAQWGNTAAVLLGDFLLTRAFTLGVSCDCKPAMNCLLETAQSLCLGELKQNLTKSRTELNEQDYFAMIEMKTADLFKCCCRLGAIASEASEAATESLGVFGLNIGCAFQIMDDLKDILSDTDTEGKTLGTDLFSEKLTLPVIHWIAQNPNHKQLLADASQDVSRREQFKNWLRAGGSVEYTIRKAAGFQAQAKLALKSFTESPAKQSLLAIADAIVSSAV